MRPGAGHTFRKAQLVVENVDENHLKEAMWLFPLYLLLINVFVLPIAFAGLMLFPGGDVDADTFVLTVPMKEGAALLACAHDFCAHDIGEADAVVLGPDVAKPMTDIAPEHE